MSVIVTHIHEFVSTRKTTVLKVCENMEEEQTLNDLLEVASKRDDPDYQQISGHIPKELATEFKIACTRNGVSHSDGLEQAITIWLNQQNEPLPPAQQNATKGRKRSNLYTT